MLRRVLGILIVAFAIILEAVEHVDFIWSHIPTKYAGKVSDPKIVVIVFLVGLLILAIRPVQRAESNGSTKSKPKAEKPKPNLVLMHCRESNLQAIGVGGLVLAFRNDALSFKDAARGVIAHISYLGPGGARVEINYGMWVEADDYLSIDRSETKHLIIGIKQEQTWSAVENIAPQTHYQQHEMVEVGRMNPGIWSLLVTLTAENFKKEYQCNLEISQEGTIKYSFPK